jgi:uncharacterized protein YbaA (DUF1428 family)
MEKIKANPRLQTFQNDMPFNGGRMIFGRFGVVVEE